jgi:hypothetical protein
MSKKVITMLRIQDLYLAVNLLTALALQSNNPTGGVTRSCF